MRLDKQHSDILPDEVMLDDFAPLLKQISELQALWRIAEEEIAPCEDRRTNRETIGRERRNGYALDDETQRNHAMET